LAINGCVGVGEGVVSGALGYDGAGVGAARGPRDEAEGIGTAFVPPGLRVGAASGLASVSLGVVGGVPGPSGAFDVFDPVWLGEAWAPARSAGDLVSELHPETKSPTRQAVAK